MSQSRSTDRDAGAVSPAPIWVALVVGVLLGLLVDGWPFILTLVLALLVGFVVHMRMTIAAQVEALREAKRQNESRLGELERELALLRDAQRSASAETTSATAPQPASASPSAASSWQMPAYDPDAFPRAAAKPDDAARSDAPVPPLRPEPVTAGTSPPDETGRSAPWQTARPVAATTGPSAIDRAVRAARDWLLGGNTVARVGLLVLFFGVAFLLRYVAERTQVPIELRLAGVAAAAIALLIFGWRLRASKPGFAITLQGGAVGILYLTVFAALRLYQVISPLPAFSLLAVLTALSGALSVLQNARALAVLGAAGGFLAPILISTGAGRIELLFSYYLLLNLGVLGIAWFRAWRELNWIAFAFTFGVSGLWAVQRYTPAQFVTGQAFLVAFWVLFLVVSMLYSLRQSDRPRGLFDTTLVFALPLAAFGIQTRFADPQAQGLDLALAAVAAGAVYLAASAWLLGHRRARGEREFQVLTEAHFGIGVALLTLAVPLAASAQWTAAAWAIEGVALLWVGLRQGRLLPLVAGVALHALGAAALGLALQRGDVSIDPAVSGFTLNLAVLALTAFASGWLLRRAASMQADATTGPLLGRCAWLVRLVGWGWVAALAWQPLAFPGYVFAWCALALVLVAMDRRQAGAKALAPEWVAGVAIVVAAAVAHETRLALLLLTADPPWTTLLARLAIAATAVAAALLSLRAGDSLRRAAAGALLTLGVLAWLLALIAEAVARLDSTLAVAQLALMLIGVTALALGALAARLRWSWPAQLARAFVAAHLVLAAYVVAVAVVEAGRPSLDYGWAVWPLAWALFYLRLARDPLDDLPEHVKGAVHVAGLWLLTAMLAAELALQLDAVAGEGWFHAAWGGVLACGLWLTVKHALRWPLRAAPFAYAQIGAPGLALGALLWLIFANVASGGAAWPLPTWPLVNPLDLASLAVLGALLQWHLADARADWRLGVRRMLVAAAFFVVNTIALRAVHVLADVPWTAAALGQSVLVQVVLSLLWTLTAITLMLIGHRRAERPAWIAGAALLAVVVAKLFFVDLSAQGTIERIVSFVGVGLLILLVGYLAPVPPAGRAERPQESGA
jgi:uncharacterized membrane protein